MNKLVIATHNKDKLIEFHSILSGLELEIMTLNEFPEIGAIEETGTTFLENSFLKARTVFRQTQIPTIADDSGLEVDYLNGAPGIHSARFAGDTATYSENVEKLLRELEGVPLPSRKARFRSIVTFVNEDIEFWTEGHIDGTIADHPSGVGGFGYDPVFYIPNLKKTFAEISQHEKNLISHRGLALKKIRKLLVKTILDTDK
ncbi:RdgB/HAM1 family non-canonical purine NTP pyrophosphatase [Candidatus Neomarinimicrobiota bacterium]